MSMNSTLYQQSRHGTPHHGQRVYNPSRLHNMKYMSRIFDEFVR